MNKKILIMIVFIFFLSCNTKKIETSVMPFVYAGINDSPFYCNAISDYINESPEAWIKKWQNIEFELIDSQKDIPSYVPHKIGLGALEKCSVAIIESNKCSESFEFVFNDKFGSDEKIIVSQIRKNRTEYLYGAESYDASWITVSELNYFPDSKCEKSVLYFTNKVDNKDYAYKVTLSNHS